MSATPATAPEVIQTTEVLGQLRAKRANRAAGSRRVSDAAPAISQVVLHEWLATPPPPVAHRAALSNLPGIGPHHGSGRRRPYPAASRQL
jgi:hypothetical protein